MNDIRYTQDDTRSAPVRGRWDPVTDLAQLICLAGQLPVNGAAMSVPLAQLRTGLVIDDPASAGPGHIEQALRGALRETRKEGPWLFDTVARADDISGLYASALEAARKLYGPDAELAVERAGKISTSWNPARGTYRCEITVRCVNWEVLASREGGMH